MNNRNTGKQTEMGPEVLLHIDPGFYQHKFQELSDGVEVISETCS
jgi:hypothetical protein